MNNGQWAVHNRQQAIGNRQWAQTTGNRLWATGKGLWAMLERLLPQHASCLYLFAEVNLFPDVNDGNLLRRCDYNGTIHI